MYQVYGDKLSKKKYCINFDNLFKIFDFNNT